MIVLKWRQRLSERWRDAIWLVTGLLLAGALMCAANWEGGRQERERLDAFRGRLADLARISESIIDGQLNEFDDALLVLRAAYVTAPQRFAENVRLLRHGPLADRELLVVLVDRDGYLAYTDAPNVKPRLYLGDRKYFRYFADGGKDHLYIDEPSFGRVTRRYTLPLARPVYDREGIFRGVIAISVKQQFLVDFGPRLQLSGDITISVINHGGAVVSRSRDLDKVQGTKLLPELLAPMLKEKEGTFLSRATSDGAERVIAYRHIHAEKTPLIVYVEASPGELLRETSLLRNVLIWGAAFTSLVIMILIAVYLQGRKISLQYIETLSRNRAQEYEILTGTALDGFWIADGSGRLLDSNETFCKMLGYTKDELLSLSVTDIEVAASPNQLFDRLRSVKEAGIGRFQSSYRRKDGMLFDVEISAQYVKEPDGRYFIFVRDVTERKMAEDMLRESEERLQLATQATTIGIWDWEVPQNVLTWDDSMYTLYGIRKEDFSGAYDAWTRTLHPDDRHYAETEIQAALRGERQYEPEFRVIRPDGAVRYIKAASRTFFDPHGKPLRMIGTNIDITERKRFEKELQDKNSELERFAYTVSHDLKSPLITIQSYAGMIRQDVETGNYARAQDDLKRIEGAAAKMTALLGDLLELSRVGRVMSPPLPVDMNHLVKETLMQLAGSVQLSRIEVVVQPDLPTVYCDQKRIAEVLQNLIENAIKYMGEQTAPKIEIGTRYDGKECVFVVSDNGQGIEPRFHKNIFGLFNKLDPGSEGTGVGLALVKRIIEVHGGRVWVESEGLGKGSRFCFTVPGRMT